MEDIEVTEQLVPVWKSMAEHFLDTETRHDIPYTALLCLQAGLSPEEAHAIWLHEVSPVVGANLLSVAGEWACWDEEWLVGQLKVRAQRRRSRSRGRPLANLLSRFRIDLNAGTWGSIERCMRVLAGAPTEQRDQLASDLSLLARHYFGFGVTGDPPIDGARVERLRALHSTLFDALEPATIAGEDGVCRDRVSRAFAERTGA